MQISQRLTGAALLILGLSTPALCQPIVPPPAEEIDLSGPRVGFTVLSQSIVDTLKNDDQIVVSPLISQFGWQFEKQFYSTQSGPTAVTECRPAARRTRSGRGDSEPELAGRRAHEGRRRVRRRSQHHTRRGGAGDRAGITFRAGTLNVPVNFAVVPSKAGTRVSVLTGFSLRRR